MGYLDEMVARSIAEERQRDARLALRQRELEAQRALGTTTVTTYQRHGRWHDTLVRLHMLHTHTP